MHLDLKSTKMRILPLSPYSVDQRVRGSESRCALAKCPSTVPSACNLPPPTALASSVSVAPKWCGCETLAFSGSESHTQETTKMANEYALLEEQGPIMGRTSDVNLVDSSSPTS